MYFIAADATCICLHESDAYSITGCEKPGVAWHGICRLDLINLLPSCVVEITASAEMVEVNELGEVWLVKKEKEGMWVWNEDVVFFWHLYCKLLNICNEVREMQLIS